MKENIADFKNAAKKIEGKADLKENMIEKIIGNIVDAENEAKQIKEKADLDAKKVVESAEREVMLKKNECQNTLKELRQKTLSEKEMEASKNIENRKKEAYETVEKIKKDKAKIVGKISDEIVKEIVNGNT